MYYKIFISHFFLVVLVRKFVVLFEKEWTISQL